MANPVRFDQSQTAVKVRRGDAFVIELPSAPTTGAAWQLTGGGLKLESESFVAESDRMGAGGMQEFTFQATQAGSHSLNFQYGRPWEKSAASTHDVIVTVED
jgi:inhibitor of cysteine peptidase